MALDGENGGIPATMLVGPTNVGGYPYPVYQNNGGFGGGFGGDSGWLFLLLILAMAGGWNNGFGGFGRGMGGFAADGAVLYPWMNQAEVTTSGFQNAATNSAINSLQNSVTSGFGDVQLGIAGVNQNICQTGNSIVGAVTGAQNALAQQMYSNQFADLERSFAAQTATTAGMNGIQSQLAQCCCDNRLATESLRATVLSENCADRYEAANNTRDIIDNQSRGIQTILDKLCALELDGYKRENDQLRSQLNNANLAASQAAQNAFISQGFANEVDALYNRLNTCPVPTTPVYGRTPIFTCGGNSVGCGCSGSGFVA